MTQFGRLLAHRPDSSLLKKKAITQA
uniref:Uncharacterized protein n=1 Tax=Rhizophora mucronata TaxID=61149 RepID=A0A2P2P4G8_RHIMU